MGSQYYTSLRISFFVFFFLGIRSSNLLIAQTPQVEFNIRLTEPVPNCAPFTYSVYVRNLLPIAPTIPTTLTPTINITVQIPGTYNIDESAPGLNTMITSLTHGTYIENASRNNPVYNAQDDFLYFSLMDPISFPEWENSSGVEIELFRFKILDGSCQGGEVSIIENGDPITLPINEPTHDFTNIMSINGGTIQAYSGNYNAGINDCSTQASINCNTFPWNGNN